MPVLNPYAILAVVLGFIGAAAAGLVAGVKYEKGQEARTEVLITKAADAAQAAAAAEIGKIQIHNQTIQQKVQETVREVPVYRDCRNTSDVLRLLDDALSDGSAEPAGSGKLPAAHATHR